MTSETKAQMTTIKVPVSLRERISNEAADEGVTAAAFLTGLLNRYERERRFAAVRRVYAAREGVDTDYDELTEAWDRAAEDDLAGNGG